ncbi:MAG: acylphosphatase [Arenimonas sp.]
MIRRQFTISGKVQGVWFRASTREQAQTLGLTGYASNLPDGRVQVQAQGEADALAKLEQWLQHGPTLAKVSQVDRIELEVQVSESGFRIQ